MGYITELEAINHMLLMAGESTVVEADITAGALDVGTAQSVLNRQIDDYTMRGLVGNRVLKKQTLSAEGKLEVGTAAEIISGELVSYHENSDGYMIQAQVRDDDTTAFLFNITDQTADEWAPNVEYTYELTYVMAWDDIDTTLQRGIMAAAARQYQIIVQGDADADQYLGNLEAVFKSQAKAANIDDRRRSVVDQMTRIGKRAVLRADGVGDQRRFRYWKTWNG